MPRIRSTAVVGALAVALGVGGSATAGASTGMVATPSARGLPSRADQHPGGPAGTATGPDLPADLPADLDAGPRATCAPDLRRGWLARENRRPGTGITAPRTKHAATLYLDTVSAVCGQVVRASVSAPAGTYRLRALRVGWYGGRGGRVVSTSGPFEAAPQANGPGSTHGRSPGWAVTARLPVDAGWPPGLYVVQLMSGHRPVHSAPLVVLAPRGARRAPALFVVPAMTWTAYSTFGGRSLYRDVALSGPAAYEGRARQADLARPVEGPGARAVHRYTTPLVRQVERAGVDVDYAADLDVDRTPSLVRGRNALVTGSHTEYVTRRVYDAFEAARDLQTNLAFLGGNGFYWQARVTRDGAGRPLAVVVHREAAEDPVPRGRRDQVTVRWRDAPLDRPEARLVGAQYDGMGVVAPLVVLQTPRWLGWRRGQVLPAGAASEVDAVVPGVSPAGVSVLAAGGAVDDGRTVQAMITYYVAPSGAAVLDAGTMYAGCSADDSCGAEVPVPPETRKFWSTTIQRVVVAFASRYGFGARHPAPAPGFVPSYQDLLRWYGPVMRGRTIGDDD